MSSDEKKKKYIQRILGKIEGYSNEEEALLVGVATGLSLAKAQEVKKAS